MQDFGSQPEADNNDQYQKINSLREMISSAERTIQGAKQMLLQLEGKKKVGRKRKLDEDADGTVVEGTFDGQVMMGVDGKQYPVPANYASKSKLVEGDMLKLTITPDGFFIYKQIGPIDRRNALGIVSQDEAGNYYVLADGKPYKVLLASITYFKAEPGDEVAVVIPRQLESTWAAIENVIQKAKDTGMASFGSSFVKKSSADISKPRRTSSAKMSADEKPNTDALLDEWTSDIEGLRQEIEASKANPPADKSDSNSWVSDIEAIKNDLRGSQSA